MKILKRNAVKCLACNTTLESRYRHNFVSCSCPNETFTDGGLDYQRYGGKDLDLIQTLVEHEEISEEEYAERQKKAKAFAELKLKERIDKGEMVSIGGQWISKSIFQLLVDAGRLDESWLK